MGMIDDGFWTVDHAKSVILPSFTQIAIFRCFKAFVKSAYLEEFHPWNNHVICAEKICPVMIYIIVIVGQLADHLACSGIKIVGQ
jgi:hypothetical protein